MSKRKMSARETRMAKAIMPHYEREECRPQRASIRLGGGLNAAYWLDEASAQGYYVERPDSNGVVVLR